MYQLSIVNGANIHIGDKAKNSSVTSNNVIKFNEFKCRKNNECQVVDKVMYTTHMKWLL